MQAFKILSAALIGSMLLYGAVFSFVLKMPLTLGFIKEAYDLKADYAKTIAKPKLVVLAGSNALFGFRCETIEETIGVPCVNASITVALGPELIFKKGKEIARPGDTVLMPLEYGEYLVTDVRSASYPYLASYEPRYLGELDMAARIQAFFSFNFGSFVLGLGETGLSAMGLKRRINARSLTLNGDFKGHTKAVAAPFQAAIGPAPIPEASELEQRSGGWKAVSDFLGWAKVNKVHIIGMLPTTVDLGPVSDELESSLSNLYKGSGHAFLSLPNKNQFPLECFYDTYYHLHEECQISHSKRLAGLLLGVL